MRWIGILGILGAIGSSSADAMDVAPGCPGFFEDTAAEDPLADDELPLLRNNRCEATKTQELRAPLMRIPQDKEDPMELSLGIKNGGGVLRFKIPFSF